MIVGPSSSRPDDHDGFGHCVNARGCSGIGATTACFAGAIRSKSSSHDSEGTVASACTQQERPVAARLCEATQQRSPNRTELNAPGRTARCDDERLEGGVGSVGSSARVWRRVDAPERPIGVATALSGSEPTRACADSAVQRQRRAGASGPSRRVKVQRAAPTPLTSQESRGSRGRRALNVQCSVG